MNLAFREKCTLVAPLFMFCSPKTNPPEKSEAVFGGVLGPGMRRRKKEREEEDSFSILHFFGNEFKMSTINMNIKD